MNEIFVSYRREKSADITGRIRHDLVEVFGQNQVFNDVYSVRRGQNFRDAMARSINRCKVYLIVMGPEWVSVKDDEGGRRIDNEDDNVRIELETAMARKELPIIPLFVGGAKMPRKEELPEALKGFVYYNGMRIGTGRDYDRDIADLVMEIEGHGVKRRRRPGSGWSLAKKALVITPLAVAAIGTAFYFGFINNQVKLFDNETSVEEPVDPESIKQTVRQIQGALNAMQFVAGKEDGLIGRSTQKAITGFQRAYGVPTTGRPSVTLLGQLRTAAASGFSNLTCTTANVSTQDCQPVTRTRTVPATSNQVEYLSAVLPCYYDMSMYCNMFDCNWLAIEEMCESSPAGLATLQQQCLQYNGQVSDYDVTCECNPTSCLCENTADCTHTIRSTREETTTEQDCKPVTSAQQQCTCKAPEVCPETYS